MDTQALGIGALGGLVTGAVLVWLWMQSRMSAATARCDRLDSKLRATRRDTGRLVDEAGSLLDELVRSINRLASEAELTLGRRAQAENSIAVTVQQLAAGEGSSEEDSLVLGAAEHATEELAGRERDLGGVIEELERRSELVSQVLDGANNEERMAGHKVDDLVTAASTAVGAASAMDNVIRKLQSSASETAELSTQVSTEAERGYRAVHRTLDEIERIRGLTANARARIQALGDRVADIGHVVRVIQDITEKTNLLALNASIIAAQAGEHGRSFAVVANEIKALAQRTAASTKEISDQIRGVQEESERATAAMVDGVAAVGEGFQVAIAAGDALDAIRQSARSAQKRVQSMTRTLRQQNNVAQQVVDSAASVSERAASFASAIRGQTSLAERLRGAALDIQSGARQIAELLNEHGASSTHCMQTIDGVVERLASLRRRERELRRGVEGLRTEVDRGRDLGDELAAQWASVSQATAQLRDRVQSLRDR